MDHFELPSYNSVLARQLLVQTNEDCIKLDSDSSGIHFSMKEHMLRTQLLLLDYKQFKAARIIQRHVRGFIVRLRVCRQQKAAAIIQRAWRRHIFKRHLINYAQERTQDSIHIMFNVSSAKIQAFFRGWWSRKHINNMLFLKNMQLQCVEELLHSFALKLRTMMRSGHLPGFVSLCDNVGWAKVQELLTTLNYRFYNRYVCNKYMTFKTNVDKHRRDFMDATYFTWVPYLGIDHNSHCQKWAKNFDILPKVYALREYDVAQVFKSQNLVTHLHKKKVMAKENELRKSLRHAEIKNRFCKDVANSMKYWRVCGVCKDKVTESLMGDKFQEYLADVKLYLETMHFIANCDCTRDKKQPQLIKCKSPLFTPPVVHTVPQE